LSSRLPLAPKIELSAAIALALARTVFCAYRAATQSIVHDEAFTFHRFVSGPWENIYSLFDANNHILYSILAKLSIRTLGLSELTLRLPSVLAGFALMLGIYCVLRRVTFGWWGQAVRWLALIAASLHPLLLDFCVAARGYGLALAFLVWAVYAALQERPWVAGMLCGFAVSANLAFAFPVLALMMAMALLEPGGWKLRIGTLASAAIPASVIATAICYPALRTARPEFFFAGTATLYDSILSTIQTSLRSTAQHEGFLGSRTAVRVATPLAIPAGVMLLARSFALFSRIDTRRMIPALTALLAVLGLIAAHLIGGLSYPVDRIGLYLVLLGGLSWATVAAGTRRKDVRVAEAALAFLLIAQFATQFQARSFTVWYYDEDSKRVAEILERETAGRPEGSVSASTTWYLQPALEFYRVYLGIRALRPIERREPTAVVGYDYYVFHLTDIPADRLGPFRMIFENPIAGVVLAAGR
jgi:hypothetical protein